MIPPDSCLIKHDGVETAVAIGDGMGFEYRSRKANVSISIPGDDIHQLLNYVATSADKVMVDCHSNHSKINSFTWGISYVLKFGKGRTNVSFRVLRSFHPTIHGRHPYFLSSGVSGSRNEQLKLYHALAELPSLNLPRLSVHNTSVSGNKGSHTEPQLCAFLIDQVHVLVVNLIEVLMNETLAGRLPNSTGKLVKLCAVVIEGNSRLDACVDCQKTLKIKIPEISHQLMTALGHLFRFSEKGLRVLFRFYSRFEYPPYPNPPHFPKAYNQVTSFREAGTNYLIKVVADRKLLVCHRGMPSQKKISLKDTDFLEKARVLLSNANHRTEMISLLRRLIENECPGEEIELLQPLIEHVLEHPTGKWIEFCIDNYLKYVKPEELDNEDIDNLQALIDKYIHTTEKINYAWLDEVTTSIVSLLNKKKLVDKDLKLRLANLVVSSIWEKLQDKSLLFKAKCWYYGYLYLDYDEEEVKEVFRKCHEVPWLFNRKNFTNKSEKLFMEVIETEMISLLNRIINNECPDEEIKLLQPVVEHFLEHPTEENIQLCIEGYLELVKPENLDNEDVDNLHSLIDKYIETTDKFDCEWLDEFAGLIVSLRREKKLADKDLKLRLATLAVSSIWEVLQDKGLLYEAKCWYYGCLYLDYDEEDVKEIFKKCREVPWLLDRKNLKDKSARLLKKVLEET